MKISIGCDHGGLELKNAVAEYLRGEGHEVTDNGTYTKDSCDYPVFAKKTAKAVASGDADFGVLVCTTGIGMSICANKVRGARAALIHETRGAEMCRRHNNANVICFGQAVTDAETACKCVDIFLSTPFEGGRHERRVSMFED